MKQPDALRLADRLQCNVSRGIHWDAAAELRRLHAEVEELRGALDEAMWHVKYKELKAVNESDTALLRQALEALRNDDIQQRMKAIAALRERLGEKT